MATINLGGSTVNYSFGAIIAILVLLACFILWIIGQALTAPLVLLFLALLALARLT